MDGDPSSWHRDLESMEGRDSIVLVDAESEPFDILRIKLSVGRWATEILRQHLQLAISDSRILELKSRHDGTGDPPRCSEKRP
jgi:hypothetical protein